MRRQGIATELLRKVAEVADAEGRRLLMTYTTSRMPAGDAFMTPLGAQMAIASHTSELLLSELNYDAVRQWQERAQPLLREFELGLWVGPYPEVDLEAIAQLHAVMNTAPRGESEVEDWIFTVEELRQIEESMRQRRVERWTMFVRERSTRNLAGYTEVNWSPLRPETLEQEDTGVFPEYRGRGLGSWLKAAMIEKVLRERPEVKRIRTGNAQSNAPMLAINFQLGFKPVASDYNWQVGLDKVQAYLLEHEP